MLKLFRILSKRTCFTGALVLFSYSTVVTAVFSGLFFLFILMGAEAMKIFLVMIWQVTILALLGGLGHLTQFGVFPFFQMKRLKPINHCIDGFNVKSVTVAELEECVKSIHKLPAYNLFVSQAYTISVAISVLIVIYYLGIREVKAFTCFILMAVIVCVLYGVSTYILSSAICDKMRRQMMLLLYNV